MVSPNKMKPRQPTERAQRLGRLMDRDTAALVRIGMAEASVITARAVRAALAAYRSGRSVDAAMKIELDKAVEPLARAMAYAHVAGRNRTALIAPSPLRLRRTSYETATRFMVKRLDMTPDEIVELTTKYEPEAARVILGAEKGIGGRIQDAMLESTRAGEHVRGGRAILKEAFDKAGIAPDNSFTIEAIWRTQTSLGYGAGRWQAAQDPALQEILWGYVYRTEFDDRVRPEHQGFEGVTLPKDDPFWRTNWPPNGFCCRCGAVELFDDYKWEPVEPQAVEVDGRLVQPSTDPGFRFNPGQVLAV